MNLILGINSLIYKYVQLCILFHINYPPYFYLESEVKFPSGILLHIIPLY